LGILAQPTLCVNLIFYFSCSVRTPPSGRFGPPREPFAGKVCAARRARARL